MSSQLFTYTTHVTRW